MKSMPPVTISSWIQGVATPLPGQPCGEDPRYLDTFISAKEEIDKLRDVDYGAVLTTSRILLTQISKDLRIAGYHLIAATYVNGLPGLLEALQAYRLLLDNFWESCHPQGENGRMAALSLLTTPRILAFAEQRATEANPDIYQAIDHEIHHINNFLIAKLGDEIPRLTALAAWSGKMQHSARTVPAVTTETQAEPTDTVSSSGTVNGSTATINSEHDLASLTRQIHTHLLRSGDLGRALAYSRAYRWGNLQIPPHENGRTKIQKPRENGWAKLQHILARDKAEDTLVYCEKLFFEPGYHLVFDLQYHAFRQAEAIHRQDLALYIQNALKDLLQRQPKLIDLAFNDGTAFAGTEFQQWLNQWESDNADTFFSSMMDANNKSQSDTIQALCQEAHRIAKQKKLSEALNIIQDIPVRTEQQRFRKALEESRLCLSAGKPFLAEAILGDVLEKATAQHIATWEPALAVEALLQRIHALKLLEKGATNEEKLFFATTLRHLRQTVCTIDVTAAAQFV